MIKPSRLALAGMAVLCATIFAACNCAPTLRYLVVAPNNGDIYVSAPQEAIKGAAKRAPARSTRRAAASPLQLSPGAVCGTLQYAATGYYSNGTTQDQSSAVAWSSSSTSVATINSTGLASGALLGFTNIGATLGGITATAVPLEVDQLNSITVNQPSPTLAVGQTQADTATGSFTLAGGGSTTQDISSQVTWAASNGNATVDTSGNVTGVLPGPVSITATSCDGFTVGQVNMTISGIALVVTPNTMTAAAGTTVQYVAMENNNGTLQPPGSTVTWSSSATTTASINATTGLAQALSASSTAVTITATEANPLIPTGTASLTVQAAAARFGYVANPQGGTGTGSISSYTVTVGASTPLAPNTTDPGANSSGVIPLPGNPQQVLLHPSGDLLFYIDSTGAVRSYFVNSANGVFSSTPTGQSPAIATNSGGGSDLYVGVIDPTGRFLYVVSQGTVGANGNGVLYGFTITHTQPSGGMNDAKLTPISGLATPTGFNDGTINGPTWILTDQTGSYLYIVNSNTNTISEYTINQTTGSLGQLTALGNSPVDTTGGSATEITPIIGRIDANGHLFVANEGNGTTGQSVTAFTITPSGQETPAGELVMIGTSPTPISGATEPTSVIASPNGNYLYVLDDDKGAGPGQVFPYGLTQPGGVISTSALGSAAATGVGPFGGMAIDPTGALLAVDNGADGTISLYTITSTGTLTPITPAVPAGGADTNTEFFVFYTAASGQ